MFNFTLLTRTHLVAILCFFILTLIPLTAITQNMPDPVNQALQQAGIPESAVAIYVHEIGETQPLIAINAKAAMNPASVMKLVTTFAGLELLGPTYTWKTELYANGIIEDGVLQGDLVIKGYGDPKLNLENFWLLVRHLRQTGLREITGNLILDNSYFDVINEDSAAFDGKFYRTYNVSPEALLVNYRMLSFHLTPQPKIKSVRVIIDPLPESLTLSNNLKLTDGECGDWRDILDIDIHASTTEKIRTLVALNGSYATKCGEKNLHLSLHNSSTYTLMLFRQLWEEQNGIFHGRMLTDQTSKGLIPLETHRSPPLAEIVRDINKFSNNIAARQLYLALGSVDAVNNKVMTLTQSNTSIRQWLAIKKLNFPELIMENGSGLSRNERISADHLGQLLINAFQSPVMPEFISSLPIVAIDGTMKERLNDRPITGQAHIKTGLLDNVKSIAGYVLDKLNRRIIVIFIINHSQSRQAQPAMDALLQWVHARP